ncbi:MAG: WYL domain-containing protein, partial [Ilumatobacteraceae bacterium]|nr:WYL domain-containing protein [Ilumatobacteraceae bacterium]
RGPRSSEARVSGLLRMLPWLMKQERVLVAKMAKQFSMSESDLIQDIEMASMCGVPPYTPFELTDIYIDDGYIFVGVNKRFERSLELTPSEAFGLNLMAVAAKELPGFTRGKDLKSAVKKLRKVLGDDLVDVDIESPTFLPVVTDAASSGQRLRITYWTPARNEESGRTITVRTVFVDRGHWYIRADDDASNDSRHFRVDRIRSVSPLNEFAAVSNATAQVPAWFADASGSEMVTAEVAASAAWVVETYPCTVREERPDGSYLIDIVSNSEHWLGRLLLRAGGAITMVAPSEMASVQARTANAVLARYRANSSDT